VIGTNLKRNLIVESQYTQRAVDYPRSTKCTSRNGFN